MSRASLPPNGSRLYPLEVGELVRSGLTPAAAWRRFLGLTAEEVAGRVELDVFTYRRMEDKKHPPEPDLWMLASALGIWTSQLDRVRLTATAEVGGAAGTRPAEPAKVAHPPLRLRE